MKNEFFLAPSHPLRIFQEYYNKRISRGPPQQPKKNEMKGKKMKLKLLSFFLFLLKIAQI